MPRSTRDTDSSKAQVRLLTESDEGKLDRLICPNCREQQVSVWFTHPDHDVYHKWFLCESCKFEARVQHDGKPKHFSEERVHFPKELYDKSLGKNRVFPNLNLDGESPEADRAENEQGDV